MRITKHLKKIAILIGSAVTISIVSMTDLRADDAAMLAILSQIQQNTLGILAQANLLPGILAGLLTPLYTMVTQDATTETATAQGNFTQLGLMVTMNLALQPVMQQALSTNLFCPAGGSSSCSLDNLPLPATIAVNDLSYTSLLGMPPLPNAKNVANAPFNYIRNAGGFNIPHAMPSATWKGSSSQALQKYENYYSTVMAVESFNGYALSTNATGMNSQLEASLISQATDPSWFTKIGGQDLGIVFRQMLLYESQIFVMLVQMAQAQKQMVTAQAMTNTILILNNQTNESMMVSNAQGTPQSAT